MQRTRRRVIKLAMQHAQTGGKGQFERRFMRQIRAKQSPDIQVRPDYGTDEFEVRAAGPLLIVLLLD
ncbi:hypothetical protein MU1_16600 [Paenibacillus glycanilyticus]|uniref:Uncharacterized protein n=1 Tax=Paenibacillus glycanilyticus TaxID=126569 RepID=A0ABQ6GB97_9BACL|nr:hypothetical protein MU1_16600 [Paenibacillus glycanilyticus]